MCTQLAGGECHCGGIFDRGLFRPHGAGAAPAVHSMGPAPLAPVLVVGTLRGSSSSTVGSGALSIREELTQPGSTSRNRVHYIWRPHHVPQTSNNVAAAAVTLLYIASFATRDPLPDVALARMLNGAQPKLKNEDCIPPRAAGGLCPRAAWQESQKLKGPCRGHEGGRTKQSSTC